MDINYYYLLFFKDDLLKNQLIEEVLREKAEFYISNKKSLDFWIVNSPFFIRNKDFLEKLYNSSYYKKNIYKNYNGNNFSIIISSNKELITWLKLRIGYFEEIDNLGVEKKDLSSDGIFGCLKAKLNIFNEINPLKNVRNEEEIFL